MSLLTERAKALLICLLLALTTLWVYWPVREFGFVFDDSIFVTGNRAVQSGLNPESIRWVFSSVFNGLGCMVWFSHMLDCQLFGMNPGPHHMVGVSIHIANSILLFLVLRYMTGAMWRPAFAAALFAFHPMRLESVAWVAERRDVLGMLFFLLTLLAYAVYAKRRSYVLYFLALVFFALGLLSKQMVVTLPCVLLLLDFWPLRRFQIPESVMKWLGKGSEIGHRDKSRKIKAPSLENQPAVEGVSWKRILAEKIPFFALTALVSAATLFNPVVGSEIAAMEGIPLLLRIQNAFISYLRYLGKAVWPVDLAILYPYPKSWPIVLVLGSVVFLVVVSFLVTRQARRLPFLSVGWFWYLGTLVPMIGLLQLGRQSIADRYTYLPYIGVFVIISWGIGHFFASRRYHSAAFSLALATIIACIAGTRAEMPYWVNNERLFARALDVTTENEVAHTNLGKELLLQGKRVEGRKHCLEALRINPRSINARNNLGVDFYKQGDYDEAIEHFIIAINVNPASAISRNSMGNALTKLGRFEEAIKHFTIALESDPEYPEAHLSLAVALDNVGRLDDAIREYFIAIQLRPDYFKAYNNLGNTLTKQGRIDKAIPNYHRALRIKPSDASTHNNLAVALEKQDKLKEATDHFREAIRLLPDYTTARNNLANILQKQGEIDEAMSLYNEIFLNNPDHANSHYNLAILLFRQEKKEDALAHFEAFLKTNPNHVNARVNAANILFSQGELEGAKVHFVETLKLDPDNLIAHNNLGNVFHETENLEQAKIHYKEVIRINPEQPEGYNNFGFMLAKQGNLSDAIEYFEKALQLNPEFTSARGNLEAAAALQKQREGKTTPSERDGSPPTPDNE